MSLTKLNYSVVLYKKTMKFSINNNERQCPKKKSDEANIINPSHLIYPSTQHPPLHTTLNLP